MGVYLKESSTIHVLTKQTGTGLALQTRMVEISLPASGEISKMRESVLSARLIERLQVPLESYTQNGMLSQAHSQPPSSLFNCKI